MNQSRYDPFAEIRKILGIKTIKKFDHSNRNKEELYSLYCTNMPEGESAYIIVYDDYTAKTEYKDKYFSTRPSTYTNPSGGSQVKIDYFGSERGAKISISRMLGYPSKWEKMKKEQLD